MIPIQNMSSGIYYLKIWTEYDSITEKIMIE
jgi:hypothetical protein